MQIYSAIFPVKESLTQDVLIQLVIEWNQGSPFNKIYLYPLRKSVLIIQLL